MELEGVPLKITNLSGGSFDKRFDSLTNTFLFQSVFCDFKDYRRIETSSCRHDHRNDNKGTGGPSPTPLPPPPPPTHSQRPHPHPTHESLMYIEPAHDLTCRYRLKSERHVVVSSRRPEVDVIRGWHDTCFGNTSKRCQDLVKPD